MIPYNKRQDAQIVKIKDYINGKREYVTGEGTSLTLENTANAPLSDIILKGNTSQNGEPTPSSSVDVNVVSGSNVISTSNKNLFNAQIQAGTYNQATYSVARDGLITQSADDNSGWDKAQTRNFYLDAGTYTINCIGKGTEKRLQIRNLTDNVNIIQTQSEKGTFTLTERKLLAIKTWGSRYPVSYYVQIEKGSEATTYEPHQGKEFPLDLGNIELCKIGDYQDYIYKKDNKWYKHKMIKKTILNGTEKWTYYDELKVFFTNDYEGEFASLLCFSNFFISKNFAGNNGAIAIGNPYHISYQTLHLTNWNITTLSDWKNWLSNNKPIVYFTCYTPTEEEITDTTLISQLNELEKAVSYDDTTNISQTNANLPFIINAEAFKKLL